MNVNSDNKRHLGSGADKSHEFSEQHNDKPELRKRHGVLLQCLCWGLTVETEVWVNKSFVCESRTETGSREIRLQYLPITRKYSGAAFTYPNSSNQTWRQIQKSIYISFLHLYQWATQLQTITEVLNKIESVNVDRIFNFKCSALCKVTEVLEYDNREKYTVHFTMVQRSHLMVQKFNLWFWMRSFWVWSYSRT